MDRDTSQSTSSSLSLQQDFIDYMAPSDIAAKHDKINFHDDDDYYDDDYFPFNKYESVFILDYRRIKEQIIYTPHMRIDVVSLDPQKLTTGCSIQLTVDSYGSAHAHLYGSAQAYSYGSYELFDKIGEYELIVLMGDGGEEKAYYGEHKAYYRCLLPEMSPTRILLDGLKQLQSSHWKKNPVIMEGGFTAWAKSMPYFTRKAPYMPVPNVQGREKVERIDISYNEHGLTYEKIFGNCFDDNAGKKLTVVTVEDPYLGKSHQFSNFVAFCELLVSRKMTTCINLSRIFLTTRLQANRHALEELSQSLRRHAIMLTVQYNNNLHDRKIEFDNGWTVYIERGLDIWQFKCFNTIGTHMKELMPCESCTIFIVQT